MDPAVSRLAPGTHSWNCGGLTPQGVSFGQWEVVNAFPLPSPPRWKMLRRSLSSLFRDDLVRPSPLRWAAQQWLLLALPLPYILLLAPHSSFPEVPFLAVVCTSLCLGSAFWKTQAKAISNITFRRQVLYPVFLLHFHMSTAQPPTLVFPLRNQMF